MNKTEAAHKISSGNWYEGDLDELLEEATFLWDEAGKDRGPWEMRIDVADMTKILTELRERRAQDE